MTEDRDDVVQDWFNRSIEEPPRQAFTLAVLAQVRRRERYLQLQRHAVVVMAFFGFYLLLSELIPMLGILTALPSLVGVSSGQWPPLLVLLPAAGLSWGLVKHARNSGFLPGG